MDAMAEESADTIIEFQPEQLRKLKQAAEHLASQSELERGFWMAKRAKEIGVDLAVLQKAVAAIVKKQKQAADAKLKEERRIEQRAAAQQFRDQVRREDAAAKQAKEKSKAFIDIIKLPLDWQEGKIAELAKKLGVRPDVLSAEFAEYRRDEEEIETKRSSEWEIEPWGEPIPTAVMLEELIARINTHIVAKPYEVLVIALWFMFAWVHDAAHYSVYLVVTAADIYCGKTTLVIDLGSRLLPKPAPMGGKLTESTLFRLIDRENPTVQIDNADEMFKRNADVRDLFIIGYTRGVPVRRNTKIGGEWVPIEYNVFCPKIVSLLGKLPPALLSRCLVIKLLRALPGEEPVEINPFNEELMEQFKILKRKLARWGNDNIVALKTATPVFPAGLTTRPKDNARLLLSIAELASPEWAETARSALGRLLLEEREPSWLERLLQELWMVFFEEKRKAFTSEELVKRLTIDPTSEWCNYQDRGRRVNQWDVGHLLKRVDIFSRQVGVRRVGGYHLKDFLENKIFERWLGRQPLNLSFERAEKNKTRLRKPKTSKTKKPRGKKKSPRKKRG
jgi:Protein of unknown function (DUF3631)